MDIEDVDPAELVNEMQVQMGHRANSQILKRWADNCGEAFDWYVGAVPGIAWMHPGEEAPTDEGAICLSAMTFDPYEYPRDHEKIFSGTISVRPNGHGPVMQANYDLANETGLLTTLFGARAVRLVKDGDRVSGVICQGVADGAHTQVNVKKDVILATGDYLGNDEMISYYMPWIYSNKDKYTFTYNSRDLNNDAPDMGGGHRIAL